MSDTDATPQDVFDLVEAVRIGMLVTSREGSPQLRARPMASHVLAEEGVIYFLTDVAGRKDDEVFKNPHVCLSYADPTSERYASISGMATVSNDRAKIRQLWSFFAKAWWDGPDDPTIRLVRVVPGDAEMWTGPGRLVTAVTMAAAVATGSRPDLGDNAKVKMG
ncbi:pyridoxamine 5'-phosphate oxidase family protein [Phreatobacter sp.]|uniref:pyridoxamine 5'-phosphate oxidase family protein n=1 Tax=Phreatobacter sp. TaxID=1966341 RepID=UPI0025EA72B5|nr:pyridoxamine 5'-phosphate oxidase family protein [Phreatobacter sp.]